MPLSPRRSKILDLALHNTRWMQREGYVVFSRLCLDASENALVHESMGKLILKILSGDFPLLQQTNQNFDYVVAIPCEMVKWPTVSVFIFFLHLPGEDIVRIVDNWSSQIGTVCMGGVKDVGHSGVTRSHYIAIISLFFQLSEYPHEMLGKTHGKYGISLLQRRDFVPVFKLIRLKRHTLYHTLVRGKTLSQQLTTSLSSARLVKAKEAELRVVIYNRG